MLGALGLGITINGTDKASPVFNKARQTLADLRQEAIRANAAMNQGGAPRLANGLGRDTRGRFTAAAGGVAGGGGGSTSGFGPSSFSGPSMGFGGVVGAGAIGAGFGGVVGKFVEFEDALAKLRGVSQATTKEMQLLKSAALDAGIATQFNPTQAADALKDLAGQGYNVVDALTLLRPTLDLAAGSLGQLSPSEAAGIASAALKAFKLNVSDAASTVDKLVQATNIFAVEAKDLGLGLANASVGAGNMQQSLDETLVAFGLVRNIVPRVETAATAVSIAMNRMVDPKVQTALRGLGVTVQDSAGKFRPFLDVVGDMLPSLEKMTDAKRSAFLMDTFGSEAMMGFNAIMSQATKGIQTSTGETVKGAEAFKYLRGQMRDSTGTAAKFADELNKGLGGQLRLLKGSVETFAIGVGEPIGKVIAPAVTSVTSGLNGILKSMRAMTDEGKVAVARWALLAGLVAALFLVLGSGAAPIVAGLALVGLAFAGIRVAYEQNVGGLADKFKAFVQKATLVWDGLKQAFTQGGFSGAVQAEFAKAENAGLKQFVINVYGLGMRLLEFLAQAKAGFGEFVSTMGPSFERVGASFSRLMVALGLGSRNATESKRSWEAWSETGAKVGKALGTAFDIIVRGVAAAMETAEGFATKWEDIKSATDRVTGPLKNAGAALYDVGVKLGLIDPSASTSGWQRFGQVIGAVVQTGIQMVGRFAQYFAAFAQIVSGVVQFIGAVLRGDWAMAWEGAKKVIIGVVKSIIMILTDMVAGILKAVDTVGELTGKKIGDNNEAKFRAYMEGIVSVNDDFLTGGRDVAESEGARRGSDIVDTQAALAGSQTAFNEDLLGGIKATLEGMDKLNSKPVDVTIKVPLSIDSEVVAEAVAKHQNDGRGPVNPGSAD